LYESPADIMYPTGQTREVRGLERQVNKHSLKVLAALRKFVPFLLIVLFIQTNFAWHFLTLMK